MVVTGGAAGIGAALVDEAVLRGASAVVVLDVQGGRAPAAAGLAGPELRIDHRICDVTDEQAVEATARSVIAEYGAPGLLCANAGVAGPFATALDACPGDVAWIFAVNVLGAIATIRAFGTSMADADLPGHILITGSEHALGVPHVGMAAYTAAKHAVIGYAAVLHRELPAHMGVTVICPSIVATDLWSSPNQRPTRFGGPGPPDDLARVAMQRGASPQEIARQALDGVADDRWLIATEGVSAQVAHRRRRELADAVAAPWVGPSSG